MLAQGSLWIFAVSAARAEENRREDTTMSGESPPIVFGNLGLTGVGQRSINPASRFP
jgi:hypothetical protein